LTPVLPAAPLGGRKDLQQAAFRSDREPLTFSDRAITDLIRDSVAEARHAARRRAAHPLAAWRLHLIAFGFAVAL
jgi:hypothetical protein